MEESILTWNVENFVTVLLMGALGFVLLATIASVISKRMAPAQA